MGCSNSKSVVAVSPRLHQSEENQPKSLPDIGGSSNYDEESKVLKRNEPDSARPRANLLKHKASVEENQTGKDTR